MDALSRYLRAALAPYNWPVWLGVHDRRSEGLYLFENGQRVSFFAWHRAIGLDPAAHPGWLWRSVVTQASGLRVCAESRDDDLEDGYSGAFLRTFSCASL